MWEGRSREPHLYMHFIHPHTRWTSRTWHTHTHRCKQNGRWFTTSLFSNVLLASSLQHPFVFTDRSWQQHLSILPLPSLQQPTPLLSTATSPTSPPNSLLFFLGGGIQGTRMEYCTCEWLLYWGSAVETETGRRSRQLLICAQCQSGQRVKNC